MKTKPVLIAFAMSLILWAIGLYSCHGAPGAAEAPGLSRIGTSKVFDPHPQTFHFRNSQHKCFVQKWERAETNSWIETDSDHGLKWVNAIEYSELEKIDSCYNLYYVKYKPRNRTFFGLLTCVRCGEESDLAHEILSSKHGFDSIFGAYSQIGKSVFSLNFVLITTKGDSADRHAKRKVLPI